MQQEASIVINRPIEDVFDFTIDHVPEWSLTVKEDEVLHQTPDRVGTTFRCVTEDHGREMVFEGEVLKHAPPDLSLVQLTGAYFDIDVEYRFDQLGPAQTRVTQSSMVTAKGLSRVLFLLVGWLIKKQGCKAGQAELASLKAKLEQSAS